MQAWELIFNWSELADQGSDAVAYMAMALGGTTLFLIRLVMALFGGDDGGDFGIDDGGGFGHGAESDAAFSMFSLLSILAFFMGTGWMGLTARFDLDLSSVASGFLAVGVGLVMMLIASGMMFAIQRAGHEVVYDVNSAVGHVGRVYLTIPAKGAGTGQVEVTVSGRRMIVNAVTRGEKIEAFTSVNVVELQDGKTLIVEPTS
jgi:hypothetical protein